VTKSLKKGSEISPMYAAKARETSSTLFPRCVGLYVERSGQDYQAVWINRRNLRVIAYCMEQSPSWEANRFSANERNSPRFMEPEVSLPRLQVPATWPYPEPDQSSSCLPSHFLKIHFNIILLSTPSVLQLTYDHHFMLN